MKGLERRKGFPALRNQRTNPSLAYGLCEPTQAPRATTVWWGPLRSIGAQLWVNGITARAAVHLRDEKT
jgi:hypothetical protein